MLLSELCFFLFCSLSNYSTVATTGRLFIIHSSFSLINFSLIVNLSFSSSFSDVQTGLTFLIGD